jgi:hypothetical protein
MTAGASTSNSTQRSRLTQLSAQDCATTSSSGSTSSFRVAHRIRDLRLRGAVLREQTAVGSGTGAVAAGNGEQRLSSGFRRLLVLSLSPFHGSVSSPRPVARSVRISRTLFLSLDGDAPKPRAVQGPELGRVIQLPEVGGLHHSYMREAA